MVAPLDNARRKRLVFRSQHRGTKEADVMLGGFAGLYAATLSEAELTLFEALLEEPDPDLVDWILQRVALPAAHDHALMRRIIHFNIAKQTVD